VGAMLYAGRAVSGQPGALGPAATERISGDPRGVAAPDFALAALDGRTVRLSDFRGKGVVLNFWATWCGPCKIEMPWLTELQQQYAAQGLVVIGVAMDDEPDKVARFVKDVGADYTILMGKESVGDAYGGVQFLPGTFYIDREGRIVERVFGLVSRSEIEENARRALGLAATGSAASQAEPAQEGKKESVPAQ